MTISKTTPSLPTGPVLTDDEWLTIRKMVHDWGLIDSYFVADYKKATALQEKLNIEEFDQE